MLSLTLERGLLRLELNTPAFAPLFQLPPRIRQRSSLIPFMKAVISVGIVCTSLKGSRSHCCNATTLDTDVLIVAARTSPRTLPGQPQVLRGAVTSPALHQAPVWLSFGNTSFQALPPNDTYGALTAAYRPQGLCPFAENSLSTVARTLSFPRSFL